MKAVVGSVAQEYQEGYSIQQNIHTVYLYIRYFVYLLFSTGITSIRTNGCYASSDVTKDTSEFVLRRR